MNIRTIGALTVLVLSAERLVERAKADADLAIALRREDEAREAALRTHEELDQLHDERLGTDGATLPVAPVSRSETPAQEVTR